VTDDDRVGDNRGLTPVVASRRSRCGSPFGTSTNVCGDIVARMARDAELTIDRQGRLVVPRSMRDALGAVPGTIRIREVEGGLLLEPLPAGRDEWWDNLRRELDGLTAAQLSSLSEESTLLDGTVGDGLRDE